MITDKEVFEICDLYGFTVATNIRPDSARHRAFEIFSHVTNYLYKSTKNSYGENIECRCVFIEETEINARCVPLDRRRYLIICDWGLFLSLQEIGFGIFGYQNIFEMMNEVNSPEGLFSLVAEEGLIGFNWKQAADDNRLSEYHASRNIYLGSFSDIKQCGSVLIEMMLTSVLLHELSHAIDGHYGIYRGGSISEKQNYEKNPLYQIAEMKADDLSMQFLTGVGVSFFSSWYPHILASRRKCIAWILISCVLVGTLWTWLDGNLFADESGIKAWGSHPSGRIRANAVIWHVLIGQEEKWKDDEELVSGAFYANEIANELFNTHKTFKVLSALHSQEEDMALSEYREKVILPLLEKFENIVSPYKFELIQA